MTSTTYDGYPYKKGNSMNFDEQGKKTLVVDFPYSEIDGIQDESSGVDMACECQRRVWEWVYQPPCVDVEGFICRSIVACWIFVPQLRSYSMTQIASRFGKKKQSLGRWVADFKQQFPEVTAHLQHIRN